MLQRSVRITLPSESCTGNYKNNPGSVRGEYVKVQYLDVDLETPTASGATMKPPMTRPCYLYLIDGTLAADEALENFEEKACAMLMTASSSDSPDLDEVKVKAGPEGARFFLIAARPLQEPVAWGGPIVMNTQEELNLAFSELESKTFIKHDKPLEY